MNAAHAPTLVTASELVRQAHGCMALPITFRDIVAGYVDQAHPSAPPDMRCELIEEYLEAAIARGATP